MHDCWETIIAGLTAVDVIIGVNQLLSQFPSKDLGGSVGYHFIDIHIGLCA